MQFSQVRQYVVGLLRASFTNKAALDKIGEDASGNLTYDGTAVGGDSETITQLSNFKKVTNEANNYSLEEKVIGTWIDGKPLYQKTFTGTTLSSNGYARYPIGASVEMGFVVNAYLDNGSNALFPIDTVDTSVASTIKAVIYTNANTSNPNEIAIYNNITSWRSHTFVMTIQYTKTTD